ncbi:MAG: CBS domain-containing protein [Candidatus Bathyarchaeia archaeon]
MAVRLPLVSEVMTDRYGCVGSEEKVSRAVSVLAQSPEVQALIVFNPDGSFRGVLTERWIIRSRLDPRLTKVRTLTRPAPKARPEMTLSEAARLMLENGLKHLPVFEDDRLVGVVNDLAILERIVKETFGERHVEEFMTRDPVMVSEDDTIGKVISLFRSHGFSRLPVVQGMRLTGIITMHDVVAKVILPLDRERLFRESAGERAKPLSTHVKGVMTSPVITVPPETSVRRAVEEMLARRISSLVVVRDGRVAGIITKTDLLEPVARLGEAPPGVLIQVVSKLDRESLEIDRINEDLESFVKRYGKVLGGGGLTVYLKQHRQSFKRLPLVHCRVRASSDRGQFVAFGESWGAEQALKMALNRLETQVIREKETEFDPKYAQRFFADMGITEL